MKHLTTLAISVTVLPELTLGPAGASPAGASSLVAMAKGSTATVQYAPDQASAPILLTRVSR